MSHATPEISTTEPTEPLATEVAIPMDQVRAFLAEIPSETTAAERRLLFELFQQSWPGRGKVVEIGPFLGGTTRAIALGMALNPRRCEDAELHTFDRFGAYYDAARLMQTLEPLVQRRALAALDVERFCQHGRFLEIFEAIHRPHPYFDLLRVHDTPLPDLPEEIDGSTALEPVDDGSEIAAVFVDGCKSWASTHYAMKVLLPRMQPGARVIFQDFGWYTCFWISAAVHALGEFLEWEQHVDATYVFRLKRAITAEQVAAHLPRTPAEKRPAFFAEARESLHRRSQAGGDLRGELIAQLHHVAALISIGRKTEAAEVLKNVDVRRYAAFAGMIRGCINSPTYRPGGKPILWNE